MDTSRRRRDFTFDAMSESTPEIAVESLLAHRKWVADLARRLAADEARADDVSQEVWLAALTRPPAEDRSPRGWLATVARNAVRKIARGESRRARREVAVAADPSTDASGDLAGRADAHRRLVAAIVDLPEPVRQAVLLRYFEGLGLREVAARMDAPFETTRKRIRRGLDLLRERLGRERALSAVLLPLLAVPRGGAIAKGVGGGVILTTKAKLAVAAAVVLALAAGTAAVLSRPAGEAPARPGPVERAAVPDASSEAEAPAPPATADAPPPTAEPVDVAARLARPVEGLVWREEPVDRVLGYVAARTGVPIVIAESAAKEIVEQKTLATLSIPDGRPISGALDVVTILNGLAWGIHGDRVVITIRGREYDPAEPVVTPSPPEGYDPDAPTSLTVRGVVRDADGRPVPGATVWRVSERDGYEPAGTADEEGVYAVEVRRPWPPLVARAPGHISSLAWPVEGEYGETLDLDLPLRGAAARVTGVVRDAAGEPLEDARVVVGWVSHWMRELGDGPTEPLPFTTKTAADGAFEDASVPPGHHQIRAGLRGYDPALAERDLAAGEAARVDLVLAEGVVVSGRVTDDRGRPVAGARVHATQGKYRLISFTDTAEDGTYRLTGLPKFPNLQVHARAETGEEVHATLDPAEGPEHRWDPVLVRGGTIRGRVVDGEGRPLAGYDVRTLREPLVALGREVRAASGGRAQTSEEGRFEIEGLSPGPRRIGVFVPTQQIPVVVVTADPRAAGDLRIRVEEAALPSGEIVLRSLDPEGEPIPGRVTIEHLVSGTGAGGTAGEDGRYVSRKLPPGEYRISVRGLNLGTRFLGRRRLTPGQRLDLGDVRFETPGRLIVKRTPGEGTAVAVDVRPLETVLWGDVKVFGPREVATFTLAPGSYRVLIQGFVGQGEEHLVRIVSGQEVALDADLEPAPVRRIALGSPVGIPGPAVLLVFRDAEGKTVFRTVGERDDAARPFPEFEAPLLAGTYRIEARGAAGVTVEGTLTVPEEAPANQPLAVRYR